jgi:hypothetical protein
MVPAATGVVLAVDVFVPTVGVENDNITVGGMAVLSPPPAAPGMLQARTLRVNISRAEKIENNLRIGNREASEKTVPSE